MRRFGHYEKTVYDLKAPKASPLTAPTMRYDYTRANEELARLEFAASYGSQIFIRPFLRVLV